MDLTKGFCHKASQASSSDDLKGETPLLQLLSIKKIVNAGNVPDRHRVIISDGEQFMQAMFATTLNEKVEDGTFRRNCVVKLTKWEPQDIKGQRILILFSMEAISYPEEKIGTPVNPGKATAPGNSDSMAVDKSSNAPSTSSSDLVPSKPAPAPAASRGPSGNNAPIFPIEGLNPYHNKWTIKARVTMKSERKRWSNNKGEGQLFSVNLMDETGEIKATAFNAAVDALYDRFEEGKVYYISKGRVVIAKKAFSNLTCDYEITMDSKTEVEECMDAEADKVPQIQYSFVSLKDLEEKPKDASVDVIAVVHSVGELGSINTKQGKPLSKRDLVLADRSGYSCRCTLWGKQAEQWSHNDNPIVAFKGLKVSDFNGRSLSLNSSSTMHIDVDMPETNSLRGWYQKEGHKGNFNTHGGGGAGAARGSSGFKREEMKTLLEVRESEMGSRDKPEFFNSRASIVTIKQENIAYPACMAEGCNKKVNDTGNGWHCEKCDKTWPKPQYRYLLGIQVADHTAQAWLQAFNDVATEIIGMNADQLMEIKDNDEAEFQKVIHKAQSKTYNFECRAKNDTYNDQTRVRYGVIKAYPLDFTAETRNLHKLLSSYTQLIPARYLGDV